MCMPAREISIIPLTSYTDTTREDDNEEDNSYQDPDFQDEALEIGKK